MSVPTPILQYTLSDATMKGLLPSGYTPLAYVEFTGTQHIDTGIKANQNTVATVIVNITSGTDLSREKFFFKSLHNDFTNKCSDAKFAFVILSKLMLITWYSWFKTCCKYFSVVVLPYCLALFIVK